MGIDRRVRGGRAVLLLLVWAAVLALAWAIVDLPRQAPGLGGAVAERLGQSGVTSPVTAVLLNFRGYDTLLEVVVLLLAVLGIWSQGVEEIGLAHSPGGQMLPALTRLLLPVMILAAGYLLWLGSHAAGGAFQAGGVLAAGGILLLLAGRRPRRIWCGWPLRLALCAGFMVFFAVALGCVVAGGTLLEYPRQWAGGLILLIESTLTLSIAVILIALFAGGRPAVKGTQAGNSQAEPREEKP